MEFVEVIFWWHSWAVNLNMADKSDVCEETETKISNNLAEDVGREVQNESIKEGTHAIYLRKAIDSTLSKCVASVKWVI